MLRTANLQQVGSIHNGMGMIKNVVHNILVNNFFLVLL